MFEVNQKAEIINKTDDSHWKYVSGINNPANNSTRAINFEEINRIEWLTGPARLKQPEIEGSEQVKLNLCLK